MDMLLPPSYGVLNRQVNVGEAGAWLWAQGAHRLWAAMPEHFWVYVYKVRKCPQPGSHDWITCPYAHKGERARRRDPQRYNYLPVSCPDHPGSNNGGGGGGFRGSCRRGLKCKYAHGVFELWLHPARFRTRMCEAGARCPRRICFFAHFRSQLREAGSGSACSDSAVSFLPPRILQRNAAIIGSSSSAPAAVARDDGNRFDLQDVATRLQLLSLCSANNGGGMVRPAFSAAAAAASMPELQVMVAPPPPPLHGGGVGGISVFSAAAPTPELGMVVPRAPLHGGCSPWEEDYSAYIGGGDDDQYYPHVDLINDLVD